MSTAATTVDQPQPCPDCDVHPLPDLDPSGPLIVYHHDAHCTQAPHRRTDAGPALPGMACPDCNARAHYERLTPTKHYRHEPACPLLSRLRHTAALAHQWQAINPRTPAESDEDYLDRLYHGIDYAAPPRGI